MSEKSFLKNLSKRSRLILLGVGLAVLVFAVLGLTGGSGDSAVDEEGEGLTYTARVEPFTVTISETGSIESRNRIVIKSQVDGRRTIIYLIDEGTQVEEGDLLVELDASELEDELVEEEIELENAEAELISARENLAVVKNQAKADIAQAKLDYTFAQQDLENYREGEYKMSLKEADSKITLARAELQQAEDTLEGSQRLFDNRYISQTELESDQLARQRAQMDLELALEEKRLLESFTYGRQIAQLESDVEQTRLALERAERKASANIAQAEARFSARKAEVQREQVSTSRLRRLIKDSRITAPAAGMVVYVKQGNRWNDQVLEEGLDVRKRQELIYLPTADAMSAKVSVHESLLSKVEVGQKASITVDALPGRNFTGEVTEIAVMPEDGGWRNPDLKQYSTSIAIKEISPALRSGMTCKAEILVDHFDEALTVPLQAVLRVDGQPCVFVPGKNGEAEARPVKLGIDNNRKVRILAGIEPGTRVLLNPPLSRGERQAPAIAESSGEEAERDRGES